MTENAVVLYVTPHPDIGHAPEQLTRLRTWAQVTGAEVVAEITDEATEETIRPGLLRALELLRAGDATTVAVADPRVIHPDEIEQEAYAAETDQAGGNVHALTGPPTSPGRDLVRRYERSRRAWTRAETVTRLVGARRKAAEQDPTRYNGGRAPFGFDNVAGQLADRAQEMAAVARIQELRRGAHGYEAIARILSAEQYRTKEGRTEWHREQVRRVVLRHGDGKQPAAGPDAREPCG